MAIIEELLNTDQNDPIANVDKALVDRDQLNLESVEKNDTYTALDKVNYVANELDTQVENGLQPDLLTIMNDANAKDETGTLKESVDKQASAEVDATITTGTNAISQKLDDVSVNPSEVVGDIQALSSVERQAAAMRDTLGDSTLGNANTNFQQAIQDKQAKAITVESKQHEDLYNMGYSWEEIQKLTKGLDIPLWDPIDLVIDIGTFGLSSAAHTAVFAARTAINTTGRNAAVDVLIKGVGREVAFGTLAGGFMSLADTITDSTSIQMVSGILGPVVTATLVTGTRKSLSIFLQNMSKNNPRVKRDLRNGFMKHPDSKFSALALEIMEDIDAGRMSVEGERAVTLSPYAKTNADSPSSVERMKGVATIAVTAKGTEAGVLAEKVVGAGSAGHLSIIPVSEFIGPLRPSPKSKGQSDYGTIKIKKVQADNISDIVAKEDLPEGHTDLWMQMFNSNRVANKIAMHSFIDQPFEERFKETLFVQINNNGEVAAGNMATTGGVFAEGKLGNMAARIGGSGYSRLGDFAKALVDVPTYFIRQEAEFQRVSKKLLKEIYGKVKLPKDAARFEEIVRKGTDFEVDFRTVEGGLQNPKTGEVLSANDNVIDAYHAHRLVADQAWTQLNRASNRNWINKGFKMYNKSVHVKPVANPKAGTVLEGGEKWSDEMATAGFSVYKKEDGTLLASKKNLITEIHPDQIDIEYKPGYSPFSMKEDSSKFLITAVNKKTGKTKTVAAGKNKEEANQLATELSNSDEGFAFVAHKKGQKAETPEDIGLNKDFLDFLRTKSRTSLEDLKQVLIASGHMDETTINNLIALGKTFNYGGDAFKRRGIHRVKSVESVKAKLDGLPQVDRERVLKAIEGADEAPLVPAKDALADYMNKVSRTINTYEWNEILSRDFVAKYNTVLEGAYWNAPIKKGLSGTQAKLAFEAEILQKQLYNNFNVPTHADVRAKDNMSIRIDWLDDRTTPLGQWAGKHVAKYLEKNPYFLPFKFTKKMGAHGAFMFNISQFMVQQTMITMSAGKHLVTDSTVALAAFKDVNDAYIGGVLVEAAGGVVDPAKARKLALLRRTGTNAALTIDMVNEYGGAVGKFRTRWGKGLKAGVEVGYGPMRSGESFARAYAFFTEYRALEKKVLEGTHAKLTSKDIDSDVFLSEVSIATERVAGNFSKLNRGLISTDQGIAGQISSMATQFMQFPQEAIRVMFGSGLTARQRAGVWAAWFGAFGLEGVPLIWDALDMYEKATSTEGTMRSTIKEGISDFVGEGAEQLGLSEEAKKFWQVASTKGGLEAITNEQLPIATRASLGSMMPRVFDSMSVVDLLGPGSTIFAGAVLGTIHEVHDIRAMMSADNVTVEGLARSIGINYNRISGLKNLALSFAGETVNGKEVLRDKRGEIVIDDFNNWNRFLISVGLRPTELVERTQERWDTTQRRKAGKQNIYDAVAELNRLRPGSPERAKAFMLGKDALIQDENYQGLRMYMNLAVRTNANANFSAELQDKMLMLKQMTTPQP